MLYLSSPLTAARCLFDASIVFPEPLRTKIRTPFKTPRVVSSLKILVPELCREAHEGIMAVPNPAGWYWIPTEVRGVSEGQLPKRLADIFLSIAAYKQEPVDANLLRMCGVLTSACVNAFLLPYIFEGEDGDAVRTRFIHDLEHNPMDLTFIYDGILQGQKFAVETPFETEGSTRRTLAAWRQHNVNVFNGYLCGNGWPVVRRLAADGYNRAANEIAAAVIYALEER